MNAPKKPFRPFSGGVQLDLDWPSHRECCDACRRYSNDATHTASETCLEGVVLFKQWLALQQPQHKAGNRQPDVQDLFGGKPTTSTRVTRAQARALMRYKE